MKRKHIAVFTPLATGHVYPALGLCAELVRRGHRVTYPTNEGFAPLIGATGAEVVALRVPEVNYPQRTFRYPPPDNETYWRWFAFMYGPSLISSATATVAELEGFYQANPPDLVLYEWFSFPGRILARFLGCPAIQIHAHFAHQDSLIRIDGVCMTPEPVLEFTKLLDSFMAIFGFEGRGHLWHAESMNVIFIPKAFQYDANIFDGRFMFVGIPLNRNSFTTEWKRREETEKPLLLISEASTTLDDRFLDACVEAFSGSQYHVVFSKGARSPEISSARLPHNFEVNKDAFNCEILPHAKVVLCQGGMGTTLESLSFGVPVVNAPSSPFNSEVAYRMDELGLGVHLRGPDLTPRTLREAVDVACWDEALRGRVRDMQDILRSGNAEELAADAVEKCLACTPATEPLTW